MTNKITKTDIVDVDIVDAVELISDGYSTSYRTCNLLSTSSSTNEVIIASSNSLDVILDIIDEPVQPGDYAVIRGNSVAGRYIVDQLIDLITFTVDGYIGNSIGGIVDFYHPPGASKVGVDNSHLTYTHKSNVQEVFEDLDGYVMPRPSRYGQFLYCADSSNLTFNKEQPIINDQGFILVNDQDVIIVQ